MKKKIITTVLVIALAAVSLCGCSLLDNEVNELNGSITGNTYDASFYSNEGVKFMEMSGQKIDLKSNVVKEQSYSPEGGWGYTKTLSSVVTVTIDGKEAESSMTGRSKKKTLMSL